MNLLILSCALAAFILAVSAEECTPEQKAYYLKFKVFYFHENEK